MSEAFALDLWDFLGDDPHVRMMIEATDNGKPAIAPLLSEIEARFGEFLSSSKHRDDDAIVLVNNMVKQIMEHAGYEHIACGLFPGARHIRSSGVYRRT